MDPIAEAELELHQAEKTVRRVGETVGDASPELRRAGEEAVRALRFYRWRVAMAVGRLAQSAAA